VKAVQERVRALERSPDFVLAADSNPGDLQNLGVTFDFYVSELKAVKG
jgi:hypothetical protein